jgi:hypothetical protein
MLGFETDVPQDAAGTSLCGRRGTVLSEELAVEVYKYKLAICFDSCDQSSSSEKKFKGQSSVIARMYDVSPKTVRDIWNHITWKYATCHLWSEKELANESRQLNTIPTHNRPGRPKGSRDVRPRQRKSESGQYSAVSVNLMDPRPLPLNSSSLGPTLALPNFSDPNQQFSRTSFNQFSGTDSKSSLYIASTTICEEQEEEFLQPSPAFKFSQTTFSSNPQAACSDLSCGCATSLPHSFQPQMEEPFPTGAEDDPFHWDWAFW